MGADVTEKKLDQGLRLDFLRRVFGRAKETLLEKVQSALDESREIKNNQKVGETSGYWTDRLDQVSGIYDEIETYWENYIGGDLASSATTGEEEARRIIKTAYPGVTEQQTAVNPGMVDALAEDATRSMKNALQGGLDKVTRLFRSTQQDLIDEARINQAIAEGLAEGPSSEGLKSLLTKLLEKELLKPDRNGERGRFLEVAGKNWRPETYAEVLVRTRTREAASLATLATCDSAEIDIVHISTHNTKTDICREFEGKRYSISGKSKRYPPLKKIPPFHGGCLHTMTPDPEAQADETAANMDAVRGGS